MRGLLYKELYVTKKYWFIYVVVVLILGSGMSVLISPAIFILISATIFGSIAISSIQMDKNNKWLRMTLTFPITIRQIVINKYQIHFILSAIGLILGILVYSFTSLFSDTFNLSVLLLNSAMALSMVFLSASISIPLTYTLSSELSVLAQTLSYAAAGIILVLFVVGSRQVSMLSNSTILFIMFIIICFIIYMISILITEKILLKRDLI